MLGSILSFLIFSGAVYGIYRYAKKQGFTFPWEKDAPAASGKGGAGAGPSGPPKVK